MILHQWVTAFPDKLGSHFYSQGVSERLPTAIGYLSLFFD